ncbi:glycosyltransferase [Paenibacillus kobensis]|uniref:glycosyltransferase n=1 Tax=Paenibacillus kobensis TaxID=59841 RepID=UPI000FD7B6D7|nr:glycosyltransferase [Paenibacillus kobensis]
MGVTVVIPTYNGSYLLQRTLLCLQHQDADKSLFEVIVCDDGSSDNTKEVACSFEHHLDLRYCYQKDMGFRAGTARNMGLHLAKYEICLFLDTGVLIGSDLIRSVIAFHGRHKGTVCLGIVHGMNQKDDQDSVARYLQTIALSEHPEACLRNPMLRAYPDSRRVQFEFLEYDIDRSSAPWSYFWTSMVSAETSLLKEVGGFDESFHGWGHEDIELGYRLWKTGAHFRADPSVRALHLPHEQFNPVQMTNRKNFLHFVRLHQELPVELSYVNGNNNFEMLLGQFKIADEYLEQEYENIEQLIVSSNEADRRLAVGYVSPQLAIRLNITDVFACNQHNADIIRKHLPTIHTAYKAGFINFCNDDYYQTAIITDVWKVIPITLLTLLLDEMLRIAKRVYVLDTDGLNLEKLPIVGEQLPAGFWAEPIGRRAKTYVYGITRRDIDPPTEKPDQLAASTITKE